MIREQGVVFQNPSLGGEGDDGEEAVCCGVSETNAGTGSDLQFCADLGMLNKPDTNYNYYMTPLTYDT